MPETAVLTGITGFIAKRIALDLLNAGYSVRGSLRNVARANEVRDALRPRLDDPDAINRLTFVELDLSSDDGWADAMTGADALIHTASPFPISQPEDEDTLIRPAVEGTLRALGAAQAAGITRVILTSSVVAIEATEKEGPYTEADWTDETHPKASAYYKSKTRAEKAAWDFVAKHPEMRLTTINPALVLGEPVDARFGTSLQVVERLMSGKDPMVPDIGFGVVDVADVSAMHVGALKTPEAEGQRFIASGGSISMPEMARTLAAKYPDRKIATRVAPKLALRVLSLFDRSIGMILASVGTAPRFDTSNAQRVLGIDFTPPEVALGRAAEAVRTR